MDKLTRLIETARTAAKNALLAKLEYLGKETKNTNDMLRAIQSGNGDGIMPVARAAGNDATAIRRAGGAPMRVRRSLSAAERKAISTRMKKYWATLMTRFMGHGQFGRLAAQARERGIPLIGGLESTGDIREQLEKVLAMPSVTRSVPDDESWIEKMNHHPQSPVQVPVQESVAKMRAPKTGELKAFVEKECSKTPSTRVEIKAERMRLLRLIRAQGIDTTEGSMMQAMKTYAGLRSRRFVTRGGDKRRDVAVIENVHIATPAESLKTVEQSQAIVRETLGELSRELRETPHVKRKDVLLDKLAQAVRVADDVKAGSELLGELLREITDEVTRFREQQNKLREFLS